VPFEDVRVSREMFMELKGKDGYSEAVPLSQLPVLQLPSGETVCQSLAILKYAGKLSKLYPEDPSEALIVDEAIESIMELYNNAPNHAEEDARGVDPGQGPQVLFGVGAQD
jgi:glutathione S-transferase